MQIKYLDVYITKVTDFQDKSYKYIVKKMKEKYPLLQEKRQGIQYTYDGWSITSIKYSIPT